MTDHSSGTGSEPATEPLTTPAAAPTTEPATAPTARRPRIRLVAGAWLGLSLLVVAIAIISNRVLPSGGLVALGFSPGQLVIGAAVLLVIAFWALAEMNGDAYMATLWVFAPILPGIAAGATIVAALAPGSTAPTVEPDALLVGSLAALAIWIVGSAPLRGVAAADIAQTRAYGVLRQRTRQLQDRLAEISTRTGSTSSASTAMGILEGRRQLEWVAGELGPEATPSSGLRWVSATGYVNVERALHRAEEALIGIEPLDLLIGDALHDYYSLRNSRIPANGELLTTVRRAVGRIDADVAADYFEDAVTTPAASRAVRVMNVPVGGGGQDEMIEPGEGAAATTRSRRAGSARGGSAAVAAADRAPSAMRAHDEAGGNGENGSGPEPGPRSGDRTIAVPIDDGFGADDTAGVTNIAAARAVLREIRFAVNDFRDDALDGIIRARNRLWRTIFVTAIATFLLLGLAVINRVEKADLIAASVLFLVGAIVGLFNRLRIEGSSQSAIDDFGLFEARLIHTPIVSGLAAVAGVVLVAVVSPAVLTTSAGVTMPALGEIFNLAGHPTTVVIAAVFGLTPGMLIERLQRDTDGLMSDLKSSEPTTKATTEGTV